MAIGGHEMHVHLRVNSLVIIRGQSEAKNTKKIEFSQKRVILGHTMAIGGHEMHLHVRVNL
jgi:hypothetical protein